MDQNNQTNLVSPEFKFLGRNMETISAIYGIFLILWGFAVTFISGSNSLTSFIPSFFGIPILFFSFLAIKFPNKKKLFMHLVVSFGLLIFIGGINIARGFLKGNIFENVWADTSKLMMLITGLLFTFLCVKSFIFARKNK